MADTMEISARKLEILLKRNEQMQYDLKMIVSIAGEIMEMIGGNRINAVTILTQAPKIIGAIQNDPEKAKFLEPENIQRLKNEYR